MKKAMGSREWLLGELLKSYEKSSLFVNGGGRRRILLSPSNSEKLFRWLEDSRNSDSFFRDIAALKSEGIIDYSWQKYFEGNNLEKIWLITERESLEKAYGIIGEKPRADALSELSCSIRDSVAEIGSADSDIVRYLEKKLSDIDSRKKTVSPFLCDADADARLLKALVFMGTSVRPEKIRLVSTRLYGDSKIFEKQVESAVLSVLKEIWREDNSSEDEMPSDDELLAARGMTKNAEIMLFRGAVSIETPYGATDHSGEHKGACINSNTVSDAIRVIPHGIRKVLFIENLANYEDYISRYDDPEELVIYHGGCYSPAKGEWFRKIHDSLSGTGASFRHWSDIDLGGFRIFTRLRDKIIPELEPEQMDRDTLMSHADKAKPLGDSRDYRKALSDMLEDDRYEVFHDVIACMLENGIKLEQESLILD